MKLNFTQSYRSWCTGLKLLVLALCFNFNALGQAGSNDATFMSYTSGINPGFGNFTLLKLIPDGSNKMVAVGGPQGLHVLNADGSIDNTFNVGGTGPNAGIISQIEVVQLPSKDNKFFIYIKGLSIFNGTDIPSNLARLNMDGTLDTSFNPVLGNDVAGYPYGPINFFKVQPDEKVLVAAPGFFEDSKLAGTLQNTTAIIRLDATGNVDASFTQGYTPSILDANSQTNDLQGFDLQSDGKIIVYCNFGNPGNGDLSDPYGVISSHSYAVGAGQPDDVSSVFRLTSSGAIDANFSAPALTAKGSFAKVQPDDKIIVIDMSKDQATFMISRLNANGSVDNTFTSGLTFAFSSFTNPLDKTMIQPDNKLVITNYSSRKIDRLTVTGAIDPGFNPGTGFPGSYSENSPASILRQSDGRYVLAGGITNYNGIARLSLVRVNTTGSIDGSFINIGYGFSGPVNAIVSQPDGKVLVGGGFTHVNGVVASKIARLNGSDGEVDASFVTGTGFDGTNVSALAYQVIGGNPKIWVGGDFNFYGTNEQHGLARLNAATGAFDDIPGIGVDFSQSVKAIAIRDGSSLYIGGDFNTYNSSPQRPLILINTTGTKINTFNTPVDFSGIVKAIALQTTGAQAGKVIVGGSSLTSNGTDYPNVMRLNTNGTLDNTFNVGTGVDGELYAIAVLPGDNVLIGGGFYNYNGASAVGLALLDGQTGALLPGFSEIDGAVNSIVVQGNTVLVGGQFSSVNANFVRFNLDGTLDTSFDPGIGPNASVYALATQSSDDKILIGGYFSSYNGSFRDNLARVNNPTSCTTITLTPATLPNGTNGTSYSQTFTASGGTGAYTFNISSGTLPGGLILTTAGVLSGIPTSAGSNTFTVTASAVSGCAGSTAYTLIVSDVLPCSEIIIDPATLPNATKGAAYSQTLVASGDIGTYIFEVSAGTLPNGITLTTAGLLSGTPSSTGSNTFTVTASAASGCTGSRVYTVGIIDGPSCSLIAINPATLPGGIIDIAYNNTITAMGGVTPYTFAAIGALPSGLSLTVAGVLAGTPTSAGSSTFTIIATDFEGCTGTNDYTVSIAAECPSISVTPSSLERATVGSAYNQTINASGGTGPYTFNVTSGAIPNGLAMNSNGVISGIPTTSGNSDFTITVTANNGCTGVKNYTLVTECPAITVTPATLPGANVGASYSQTLTASGAESFIFSVTNGALPTGLTLTNGGLLSGTLESSGTSNFTITATAGNGCLGVKNYTIVSACLAITVTPAILPDATVGVSYSRTLTASGAGSGASYIFSISQGALPAGLTLTNAGSISGTPTSAGNSNFTVTATANNGCSASRSYTGNLAFCINPARPAITLNTTNPSAIVLNSNSTVGNQWYFNSALITGATSQSLTVTNAGIYNVKVTVDNCSSETSAGQGIIVTGDIQNIETGLVLFPNPVKDKLMIRLDGFTKGTPIVIVLRDMLGAKLDQVTSNHGEDVVLDVSSYTSGNYIVSIVQGERLEHKKFIKQ